MSPITHQIITIAGLSGIVGGILHLDNKNVGNTLIGHAIFCAPIIALANIILLPHAFSHTTVIHALEMGIIIGAMYELVWINKFPVGVEIQPEGSFAAICAITTTLCVNEFVAVYAFKTLGMPEGESINMLPMMLALYAPLAYVSQLLNRGFRRINTGLITGFLKTIRMNRYDFQVYNTYGILIVVTISALVIFISILFGYMITITSITESVFPKEMTIMVLKSINASNHFLPLFALVFFIHIINTNDKYLEFIGGGIAALMMIIIFKHVPIIIAIVSVFLIGTVIIIVYHYSDVLRIKKGKET